MGSHIIQCFRQIVGTPDNTLLTYDHSTYGNFSPISRFLRFNKRLLHKISIIQHIITLSASHIVLTKKGGIIFFHILMNKHKNRLAKPT